jgi:hypothetical protein
VSGVIDHAQTRAWAKARVRLGLGGDTPARRDVMSEAGVRVGVLPPEPLGNQVDFDDEMISAVLPQRFEGRTANSVAHLDQVRRTASMVCRLASAGDGKVRGYVGLRRDGGVEAGLDADVVRYESGEQRTRVYRLFTMVHLIRQVIVVQAAAVTAELVPNGPFQIVLVAPDGQLGRLGGYAPGWHEPEPMWGDLPVAAEEPLIVMDVSEWPVEEDDSEALLQRFAARICDAFNDGYRRFRSVDHPGEPLGSAIDPTWA